VAFLTDATAVSRAEAELSFVEDGRLAAIVGAPTAGTRGEVDEMDLPGGTTLVFWTGTLALNADGTPYHGRGITPTIAVQPTIAGLAAGRDEVLDAAVAALLGR
jgi:C-terminal processing protease CtpA/Prc